MWSSSALVSPLPSVVLHIALARLHIVYQSLVLLLSLPPIPSHLDVIHA